MKTKICPSCNQKTSADSDFCPWCGKQIKKQLDSKIKRAVKKNDALKKAEFNGMVKASKFFTGHSFDDNHYLIEAVLLNNLDMVQVLIDADVDINETDDDGDTALMWAIRRNYNKIVNILINAGSDVNCENNDEETPLSIARENGNNYLVGVLHKAGACDEDNYYDDEYYKAYINDEGY